MFIKTLKALLFFYAFFAFAIVYAQRSSPPNIVLFLVDDMGWQDTSVPFWNQKTDLNLRYHTPNMEKLATQGMKFTQAYACSVCSPARISLMTGANAARHRVTNWTLYKDQMQPMEVKYKALQFPFWNVNGMSPEASTKHAFYATPLPQLLKDAGYYTIHAGKAHFGAIGTPAADPENIGFNVNIAGHAAGAPGSYYGTEDFGTQKSKVWGVPGLEAYHGKNIFLTEALTIEALKAVEQAVKTQKPFFLYMAHYAVHTPIMGDKRFLQRYLDKGLDPIEARYATLIEGMDKSLGDIMEYLRNKGLAENTVILFMSDNGGLSAVARGGKKNTHNRPLASGKGSAYEGGIREPMIVKWPGKVKPNSVTNAPVIIEDFFSTILEIAGVSHPETVQKIDGKSFVPVLTRNKKGDYRRPLFWHYPNEWGVQGPGIGATSTVRKGNWKLIYFHLDSHFELYNIKDDIGERHDLSKGKPQKVRKLAKILTDYLISVDAQMPVHRKTKEKVAWPFDALKNDK